MAYIVSDTRIWAYTTRMLSYSEVQKYLFRMAYDKTQKNIQYIYTLFVERSMFYILGNSDPVTPGSVIDPTSRMAIHAFRKRKRRIKKLVAFGAVTAVGGVAVTNLIGHHVVHAYKQWRVVERKRKESINCLFGTFEPGTHKKYNFKLFKTRQGS